MTAALIIEQLLNGLQLGVMLFLIAAGLTLIFGVMGFIIGGVALALLLPIFTISRVMAN